MIKEFKTSKGEFIAILIPNIKYSFVRIEKWAQGDILHGSPKMIGEPKLNTLLPKGDYQIIGLSNQITEKRAKEICSKQYFYTGGVKISAKSLDIFKGLMESIKCYSFNPVGQKPNEEDYKLTGRNEQEWKMIDEDRRGLKPTWASVLMSNYTDKLSKWKEAEENTGSWLILKKIEE